MGAVVLILLIGAVVQVLARAGRRFGYSVTMPIMLAVWVLATIVFVTEWRFAAYSGKEVDWSWTASFIIGAPAVAFFTTLMWHDGRRRQQTQPSAEAIATHRLGVVARCGLLLLASLFGLVIWLATLTEPRAWLALLGSLGAATVCVWSAAAGAVPQWLAAFLRRDLSGRKNL